MITRLGARVRLLHVTDGPGRPGLPHTTLGAGAVDLPGWLAAAEHVRWHVVELDECATDAFAGCGTAHDGWSTGTGRDGTVPMGEPAGSDQPPAVAVGGGVTRTVTRLADGRELIYYDEVPRDHPPDSRRLPPPAGASQLRYDPLLAEWVTVATHRQDRSHLPPADRCPLCPSVAGHASEIPAEGYDVVVFENRFPSFSHHPAAAGEAAAGGAATVHHWGDGLVPMRAGVGRCEVICFTPVHDAAFAQLDPHRVATVMTAWVDRTAALSALPEVRQVVCFENRGEEIGVSLHHPHGQIYACPLVAPRTRRMLASARDYAATCGGNLFAAVLASERTGPRVVAGNEHWTAFVPAFARWPYEIHLYPHRRVPDLPALSPAERAAFAEVYLDVLRRLEVLFGPPMPYVSAWHQSPTGTDRDLAYLHLQLFSPRRAPDRLKHLAASEAAMGVFVNDIGPEQAARRLREATW